ncbi:hypothetical protein AAG906_025574 [Vitis piasezkii]
MASWKTTLLLLTLFLLSLFLELLLAQATIINSIDGGMNKGCIEVERKALLEFKNGLKDPSGWLSSWVGADCCKWKGVDCNNQTGHVVKVDLKSGGDFSRLGGPIPTWIGNLLRMKRLHLSNNLMNGTIPKSIGQLRELTKLNLNWNAWEGTQKRLRHMILKNVGISDAIPEWLWKLDFRWLDLSRNQLYGTLPNSLSFSQPALVDLSFNRLGGPLPLRLNVSWLYLGNNLFSGPIPLNIGESSSLEVLDVSGFRIGERMPSLEQLRLRGNMLTGDIPEQLYRNFDDPSGHDTYSERMELVVKGQNMEFDSILPIVNLIDLSSNNIWGEIPKEITNLSTLGTLNLSRNQLTGKIPEKIGAMQGLETLDLSCNRLSGPIPPSMSSITLLNHLNLSHNLLSGPIPTTNQFSTFNDPSIYEANLGLCGPPLSTNCSTLNDQDHKDEEEDEDEWDLSWFFISMGLGFPVGFWAVCGSLALKQSWRQAYFRFIDETRDRLYVFTAVNVARLKRKMEANGVHG